MRRYETFVIIDPDLSQDQRDQVVKRVEDLIGQMDGFLVFTDDWGERKLAYDIKKRSRGYYVRFDYCGLSPLVDEIERFFRIDDRALKYMTVLLDKTVDLAKVKEEQTEAATKAKKEKELKEEPRQDPTDTAVDAAPAEDTAQVEDAVPADKPAPAEDPAKAEDSAPGEAAEPVEKKLPKNVAPSSDESDSAADTTPEKNPEEA
jgi:small subunit ribosomal protein S6